MCIRDRPLEDALYYIYSSNLYKALLDENTKLWYSSTLSPVSYTHLDVYKRQIPIICKENKIDFDITNYKFLLKKFYKGDVYKRQV